MFVVFGQETQVKEDSKSERKKMQVLRAITIGRGLHVRFMWLIDGQCFVEPFIKRINLQYLS